MLIAGFKINRKMVQQQIERRFNCREKQNMVMEKIDKIKEAEDRAEEIIKKAEEKKQELLNSLKEKVDAFSEAQEKRLEQEKMDFSQQVLKKTQAKKEEIEREIKAEIAGIEAKGESRKDSARREAWEAARKSFGFNK